jgi:hypothetical protein
MANILELTPNQILAIDGIDLSFRERMFQTKLPRWVDNLFWHNATSSMPVEPYVITTGQADWQQVEEGDSYQVGEVTPNPILVANKRYMKSLIVKYSQIQYDKYDEILMEAERIVSGYDDLWMSLVLSILNSATTSLSYDGAAFYSAAHKFNKNTSQSNLISVDISALPTSEHGSGPTSPSPGELRQSVAQVVSALRAIKSGKDEYPNAYKSKFHVLFPEAFRAQAEAAYSNENLAATLAEVMTVLGSSGVRFGTDDRVSITYDCTPALNYSDSFIVSVVDTPEKPFVRQTKEMRVDSLLYDSDQFKKMDILEWPVKVWCGAGNFHWYRSAMGKMI